MRLEEIVPWGRNRAEYTAMFELTEEEDSGRILDCAGGPSSFNAEATRDGVEVVSCDPLYRFSPQSIASRVEATREAMMRNVRENAELFVWNPPSESPEKHEETRMDATKRMLEDLPYGLSEGRYVVGELPNLLFPDGSFDLALCSHFLFTYSAALSLEFHIRSVVEMLRVAQDVRVFPLLASSVHNNPDIGRRSPHLEPVMERIQNLGYEARIQKVPYEFQIGGDEMLRVTRESLSELS